jgi:hypothetical protein
MEPLNDKSQGTLKARLCSPQGKAGATVSVLAQKAAHPHDVPVNILASRCQSTVAGVAKWQTHRT